MRKKSASFLLTACLATSLAAPVYAARFSDTNIPWMKTPIENMVSVGAVTGYPDGTFKPTRRITRAEFVTMVNKTFKLTDTGSSVSFPDVSSSLWYHQQVASAKTAGYVSGYPDKTFQPNRLVTRAEAAGMLGKLLGLTSSTASTTFLDASAIPDWAQASITGLASKGIMNGYNDRTFKPRYYITRAEAAVMLDKARSFKPAASEQPKTQNQQSNQTPSKNQTSSSSKNQQSQKPQPAAGSIRGKVTLDDKPVSSLTVKAIKSGAYEPEREVSVDFNGNYSLDVPPGTYTVVAAKGTSVAYEEKVKVTSNNTNEVNLRLKKGIELSGKLLSQYAYPVRNAKIAFTANNVTFTGKTDSEGEYHITVLPNQTYSLRMLDPNNTSKGFQQVKSGIKAEDRNTSLPSMGVRLPTAQVQAKESKLLGYKEVTVTLSGTTSPRDYRVKVENQYLIYSVEKKKFFGVVKSTLGAEDMYVSIETNE